MEGLRGEGIKGGGGSLWIGFTFLSIEDLFIAFQVWEYLFLLYTVFLRFN